MSTSVSYELVPTHHNSDNEGSEEDTRSEYKPSSSNSMKFYVRGKWSSRSNVIRSTLIIAFCVLSLFILISGFIAYTVVFPNNSSNSIIETTSLEPTSTRSTYFQFLPSPEPSNPLYDFIPINGTLWQQDIFPAASELSILVHDINQDGIPDLIMDQVTDRFEHVRYRVCPNESGSCLHDFSFTPCRIRVIAVDGRDGSVVWGKWVEFTPFAVNCEHDLNNDAIPDCTFSGRQGSFVAINPVDGSVLWYIDRTVTFPTYNYYYPLFIRDFDKDSVMDIIVTHGGDTVYDDEIKNRSPGLIFVVSGKTGQQLSDRIPMPDGHETYSSPIAYNVSISSIELVLFGSGGETIPGSLWAITLQSLQDHVDSWAVTSKPLNYNVNQDYFDTRCLTDDQVKQMRPSFQSGMFKRVQKKEDSWLLKCPVWNDNIQPLWNPFKLCIYEFLPAGKTGTIVPPVVIDYNGDGIKDILVSQFNDHLLMIDGASSNISWDHYVEGTQSYSVPSPINFNDDETMDFVVQFNKGKWMNYDYSYVAVIDGADGKMLWSINCSMGSMASPVTVKSKQRGDDGMLFIGNGCTEEHSVIKSKRHFEERSKDGVCLTAHWGAERSVCLAESRYRRHDISNDDLMDVDEKVNIINGDNKPLPDIDVQIVRPIDVNISEIKEYIPSDLWEPSDESDLFPDPEVYPKVFIQDYCNIPYDHYVNKVYFITPKLIKLGKIRPLIISHPYIYKSTKFWKRHGNDQHFSTEKHLELLLSDKKSIRCSHVMVPLMIVTTPSLGDFNNDGKLDAAVSIGFNGYPSELSVVNEFHLPKVSLVAFTVEDKLKHVHGEEINDVIDFGSYYPINEQPWSRYMGSRGNCVYNSP